MLRPWRRMAVLVGSIVLVAAAPAAAVGAGAAPDAPLRLAASGPVVEDPAPTGPDCTTTPSTTRPGYSVADPRCVYIGGRYTGGRFTPLTDEAGQALTRTYTGIVGGAGYRIEVPERWNGDLVLWAHGYRGTGTTVYVDDPTLRAYFIERGFAWAASSFATNGYDVGQGVRDSHALIDLFRGKVRPARSVYMAGASMGGHVTAVAIERYRGDFAGAMPVCGVLGDKELFDYFLDANVTAAGLTDFPIEFPASLAAGQAYLPTYRTQVLAELPELGSGFTAGNPAGISLTPLGQAWAGTVQQRSGGTRPGFASAFAYWSSFGFAPLTDVPFLFGLYPGLSGGTIGIADGNVTDNRRTVYRIEDGYGPLTAAEQALNQAVLRVAPTAAPSPGLDGIPKVFGDPRIPVLSLHDVGDLFVPFRMEQVYAARVAWHGQSRLFVSRVIRGVGHCDFTQAELRTGFSDLVSWVRHRSRPAGDRVLDPRAVASPTFGCRFTDPAPGAHVGFVAAQACPAA